MGEPRDGIGTQKSEIKQVVELFVMGCNEGAITVTFHVSLARLADCQRGAAVEEARLPCRF